MTRKTHTTDLSEKPKPLYPSLYGWQVAYQLPNGSVAFCSCFQDALRRYFVYLRNETPRYQEVLRTLAAKAGCYIAVLPGLDPALRRQLIKSGWQVHTELVRLAPIVGTTEIAITNGGHGVLSYFALNGVPCLYLPGNIDQLMLGSRAEEAGLGTVLRPGMAARLAAELDAWNGTGRSRAALDSFKDRHRNVSSIGTVELVIKHLLAVQER